MKKAITTKTTKTKVVNTTTTQNLNQTVSLLSQKKQIRNLSVIAHVDHGKTTLVDSLLAKAGIIKEKDIGDKRGMDTTKEEQERIITIKSTGISLVFKHKDKKQYLINLVDSPGHVDFSSEVSAALRITDGALIVVDCVSGVCVQTETVTRQAVLERIKPVLHINKLDRGITELGLSPEELYKKMEKVVENVNVILSTYQDDLLGDIQVDPVKGNVSFGSGKQGWAFTLPQMASIWAKKRNKDPEKILKRLWGNNFFDPETKRFTTRSTSKSGKPLKRLFVQVVLDPLYKIFDVIKRYEETGDKKELYGILDKIDVKLSKEEETLSGSKLQKSILHKFLPCGDALCEMFVNHLPSPEEAQKYRVENLYTGPKDDECAQAIRNCDENGPLMIYISKMVPTTNRKNFYAFGRVFSGTVKPGQSVRIMGSKYEKGKKTDLRIKTIPSIVLMMAKNVEAVDSVPCGNTVGIIGIDKDLLKSGTLSTSQNAYPITPMVFSVSPVVRVAIETEKPQDRPKLIAALELLSKSDPCLHVFNDKTTGEHIIAGAGELHLETCLNQLENEFLSENVKIQKSNPIVTFCESIADKSESILGKSSNKHNRIWISCEPLSEGLPEDIENNKINPVMDPKERAQVLRDKYNWEKNESMKIMAFGPERKGANLLVDATVGVQYLREVNSSVCNGLELACTSGPLTGEPIRGVRFNLNDAKIHSDPPHRSGAQITPATKRAMFGAFLSAKPVLLEPVYRVEIQTSRDYVGSIYGLITRKRGYVFDEVDKLGTPLVVLKGYLPVLESFGFAQKLMEVTSGHSFPQMSFEKWSVVNGDPFEEGSLANKIVMEIRKRKGMKETLPDKNEFIDRL